MLTMCAMLMRFLLLGLFVSPLLGCLAGSAQSRVSNDYAAQGKKVGIVSLLGTHANVSYLSTSALDSRFGFAVSEAWQVDRIVSARLVPRLEHKGFAVRMLPRSGAFAAAQRSDWRAPLVDSVAPEVYTAGRAAGVDMVVVVQPQVDEDFVTQTNQKVRGYGIQRAFDTGAFVYATIMVEAYDVAREFAVGRAEGHIVRPANDGLWRTEYDTISGPLRLDAIAAGALDAQLAQVLGDAIGVATQEAGL